MQSDALETSEEPLDGTDEYSELGDTDLEESEAWIDWFCGLKGNEFFVAVEEEYIRDDFNLTGLKETVPYYDSALDIVLDNDDEDSIDYDINHQKMLQRAAQMFYGLIHARFILTARGLSLMSEKYKSGVFGQCPNAFCANQLMLPVGMSDFQSKQSVKVYCPRCNEVYHPRPGRMAQIDGAFFGTTFAHIFSMVNPSLVPQPSLHLEVYVPKIYGFRVQKDSKDRLRALQTEENRIRLSTASNEPLVVHTTSVSNTTNTANLNAANNNSSTVSSVKRDEEEKKSGH